MSQTDKINYLVGKEGLKREILDPFNEKIINFFSDLSKQIMKDKSLSKYPDLMAFAFFCRKANLKNLKNKLDQSKLKRLGLGILFHITPSNIPTNFAYSLLFGLINGNTNLVKVPSQEFEQVNIICKCIKQIIKKKHQSIKNMIKVVRYKNNDAFTKKISQLCDCRIIWGGDQSIEKIRSFTLNPNSLDLSFADRFSLCIINTDKLAQLSKEKFKKLIYDFYNDTFVVDQNACSSPHLILWKGKKNENLKQFFWSSLNKLVKIKYDLNHTAAVDKYSELCKIILQDDKIENFQRYSNNIYTIDLKRLPNKLDDYRGKWGFFYQFDISKIKEIQKYINKKFQTLTYFGFSKKELNNFIFDNKIDGIDRIVPIGQALDIDFYWDGYDINKILSRIVDVR